MAKRRGHSYQKRVADINRIYDQYAPKGLSNREIWRRYIYPVYGISERSFYNILKAPTSPSFHGKAKEAPGLFDFLDEYGPTDTKDNKEDTAGHKG